ncbi:hypothetical protein HPB48_015011 [Haemaphysalis longicornis]|uniref:Uncharacterized protein n=1 Tax=Haemaphysalis longicornis TaxID=44386 RepID=A0A9J6GN46_HAELO|nr:hypothetical protein HPB48_015011 [Haemaphysalis longicornis]
MSLRAGYRKRVIDRLLLNMRLKRDTDVDLYAAIEMLQAAWMSVTATTIANCFRHASFAAAPNASNQPLDEPAVPDGFTASEEVSASWGALRDAGVVPGSESFCDYVSVDSEVVATEQLTDDDVVRAVNEPDETSDDESAAELEASWCRQAVIGMQEALARAHEAHALEVRRLLLELELLRMRLHQPQASPPPSVDALPVGAPFDVPVFVRRWWLRQRIAAPNARTPIVLKATGQTTWAMGVWWTGAMACRGGEGRELGGKHCHPFSLLSQAPVEPGVGAKQEVPQGEVSPPAAGDPARSQGLWECRALRPPLSPAAPSWEPEELHELALRPREDAMLDIPGDHRQDWGRELHRFTEPSGGVLQLRATGPGSERSLDGDKVQAKMARVVAMVREQLPTCPEAVPRSVWTEVCSTHAGDHRQDWGRELHRFTEPSGGVLQLRATGPGSERSLDGDKVQAKMARVVAMVREQLPTCPE